MRISPAFIPYQPPLQEPPPDPSLRLEQPHVPERPLNLHYERYHEVGPDDPMWTATPDQLPDGVRRIDSDHGQQLQGLKVDGMPVTYSKRPEQYVWTVKTRETARLLRENAPEPHGPPSQQGAASGVKFREWTSPNGSTSIFALPGGDLPVFSQKPLEPVALQTMASALAEVPPAALRGVNAFYVAERVGEGDVDGEAHPVGAVTVSEIPTIIFDHASLRDPGWGRTVVLHEVGHIVDGLASDRSVSQTDDAFQPGHKFEDRHHVPDPRHDDYISWYACTSPAEDFAETHALVLEARTAFNAANPGHDLLNESPEVAGAYLSPALAGKAGAVVRRYQQLASA